MRYPKFHCALIVLMILFSIKVQSKNWRAGVGQTVIKGSREDIHPDNSHASGTPVTDGNLVYLSFLDVDDVVVAAYDFSGNQVWMQRPGKFESDNGYSCSPTGDLLLGEKHLFCIGVNGPISLISIPEYPSGPSFATR